MKNLQSQGRRSISRLVIIAISLILVSVLIVSGLPRSNYAIASGGLVQEKVGTVTCSTGSSCVDSLTLGSHVTATDVVLVMFFDQSTTPNLVLKDSLGSSYSSLTSSFDGLFVYAATLSASGSDKLTINDKSTGSTAIAAVAFEVTGITTINPESVTGSGGPCKAPCVVKTSTSLSFSPGSFLSSIVLHPEGGGFTAGPGFARVGLANGNTVHAEFNDSGVASPTNFPASFSTGTNISWDELAIVLEPASSVTTTTTSPSTVTVTATVTLTPPTSVTTSTVTTPTTVTSTTTSPTTVTDTVSSVSTTTTTSDSVSTQSTTITLPTTMTVTTPSTTTQTVTSTTTATDTATTTSVSTLSQTLTSTASTTATTTTTASPSTTTSTITSTITDTVPTTVTTTETTASPSTTTETDSVTQTQTTTETDTSVTTSVQSTTLTISTTATITSNTTQTVTTSITVTTTSITTSVDNQTTTLTDSTTATVSTTLSTTLTQTQTVTSASTTTTITVTSFSTTTATSQSKTPTSTNLACSPTTVKAGGETKCSAIIISQNGAPPAGVVKFVSSLPGNFSKVVCSSSPSQFDCNVNYTPTRQGIAELSATYFPPTGSLYAQSRDKTPVKVTAPLVPLNSYIGSNALSIALQLPALNEDSLAGFIASGPLLVLIGVSIYIGIQRRNRLLQKELFSESPQKFRKI